MLEYSITTPTSQSHSVKSSLRSESVCCCPSTYTILLIRSLSGPDLEILAFLGLLYQSNPLSPISWKPINMIAWFLLGSAIAYGLVITIYRLYIHPLSKFPGHRLAALTGLYEVFCTAWGADSFDDEIDRMHQIYGDILPCTTPNV